MSKPMATVTGWYGGYPVIEPIDGWIPAAGTVLYSSPEARKPLTDEEIEKLLFESHRKPGNHRHNFARLIEQAHGIGGE